MNFCLGKLILKLLAPIGEWHQNLSDKTVVLMIEWFDSDLLRPAHYLSHSNLKNCDWTIVD